MPKKSCQFYMVTYFFKISKPYLKQLFHKKLSTPLCTPLSTAAYYHKSKFPQHVQLPVWLDGKQQLQRPAIIAIT